jgi:tetratricopeptide (TPR) repeat protein
MVWRRGAIASALFGVIVLAGARSATADPYPVVQGDAQPLAPDPLTVQPWSLGISGENKARARQLLARGNELLVQNRYAAALEQYELAIAAWDHPAIRANMVVCLINLARPLEAYESALLALQYGPAPLDKPEVYAETQNYRKLLEGQISALEVSCGEPRARVTLDGQDLLACPGRTRRHVIAGRHQLVAYKTGFLTVTRDFTSTGGAAQSIDVRLVRLSDAARIERPWDRWKPWAVTAGGAALVLASGALQLKADADMDRHDADLERLCGGNGCDAEAIPASVSDRKSRAELENKLAVAALVTGGVVAITGLVGVYLNRPRTILPGESGAALGVGPLLSPDGAGLALGGRF